MTLTDAETGYLASQRLDRLATIQPDGNPQVKPVGFRYNPELGTIDVTGAHLPVSGVDLRYRRVEAAVFMLAWAATPKAMASSAHPMAAARRAGG